MNTKESLLASGFEGNSEGGVLLPVTRRNALLKAAFLLGNRGEKSEIIAAIRGAAEILPTVKWGAEAIKDCVTNYYFENNRYPRVSDLGLLNGLPPAEAIKYVFGVSAQRWLDGYRCFVVGFGNGVAKGTGVAKKSAKNIARVTRMQALRAAESVLDGEEKERVREMIAEYPITEWNERNVADVLLAFYEKYGRVPAEREMKNSCELPYYGIFRYRFQTSYHTFLKERLPGLYKILCRDLRARNIESGAGEAVYRQKKIAADKHKIGRTDSERDTKHKAKNDAKRGKFKKGNIKSIKIIRVDFGGSFFYPTCSNVQDYYFWEEEKKYKDTFILDHFLNKSAQKSIGDSSPDNVLTNAPDNKTDNELESARKISWYGKPSSAKIAAWDNTWEIAKKTARLIERESALKSARENARENAPSGDSIHASTDGRTGKF